jgi:hypothetical protein
VSGSLPQPDNRAYLGTGGSGKTTLALAQSWEFERVIIVDPNGEDAHAEGAIVTDDPGELAALFLAAQDQRGRPLPLRVCFRLTKTGPDGFETVNKIAWAAEDLAIMWDEADLFMTAQRLPPEAYRLWNTGRHARVRVFLCSRRAARISRDCTANVTQACVFQHTEPRDLRFLAELMDDTAAAACGELPPYHLVHWTRQGREGRPSWTVDRAALGGGLVTIATDLQIKAPEKKTAA